MINLALFKKQILAAEDRVIWVPVTMRDHFEIPEILLEIGTRDVPCEKGQLAFKVPMGAECHGDWAIHPPVESHSGHASFHWSGQQILDCYDPCFFDVTHIPTGKRLWRFERLTDARLSISEIRASGLDELFGAFGADAKNHPEAQNAYRQFCDHMEVFDIPLGGDSWKQALTEGGDL